ncbi:MAG: nucleotide exchange factor GrpE [candidate division KSB1 bacterium]|nr:nucleotide exchange factor GrpE [candidate division KSB1 bacterium]
MLKQNGAELEPKEQEQATQPAVDDIAAPIPEAAEEGLETAECKKKRRRLQDLEKELERKDRLLEEKERELEELRDLYIRKLAEFDNFRKRTQREFVELVRNANADLILQILPVVDDFERSLKVADQGIENPQAFVEGVRMIYQKLVGLLEKQGVKKIESVGKPFDPEKHEALLQVEVEGVEPNTVIEEHQPGYFLNDKVLRHAKVIVSK